MQGRLLRQDAVIPPGCGNLEAWRDFPTMLVDRVAAISVCEEIHAWEAGGAESAEALSAWVSARLAAHEEALAALLAADGPRTPENTLRLYDVAVEQLALAGA